MSDDDLGLPDPDDWKRALPDEDDWKRINAALIRKDLRHLRDKATLDFETGEIKPATDLLEWAQWFENASRHIARDEVSGFIVSTVFMGINHSFGNRRPLWFETMVFRQMDNKRMLGRLIDQWRYATLDEARAGHDRAKKAVEKGEIGE